MVSVSKNLTFAFHHLVISGVSCFSCLWLELVPPVILLPLSAILGVQLSPEFQWSEYSQQASPPLAGKVHRGLAFTPASWLKMEARNRACPRRCVASAVFALTCADWSQRDLRHNMAPSPALAVRALPGRHLCSSREGARMSGAQNGGLSQKLCCFFSLLAHPPQSAS